MSSRIQQYCENLKQGIYVKFGYYTLQDQQKARDFNIYLRDTHRKVVIDADLFVSCNKYKYFFFTTYFNLLLREPKKFVIHKQGVGWSSEAGELHEWQISANPKRFPCYFYSLFTNATEKKCENPLGDGCFTQGISVFCNHCYAGFCTHCFLKFRDALIKYNDWFKCPVCKELNPAT